MKENEDHFRRCWITLRATATEENKWKLLARMNEIECGAEGVKVTKPSPKKKSEENQNASEPAEEFVRI